MRSQMGHVLCKGRRRGPSSPAPIPTLADLVGALGERLSGEAEGLLAPPANRSLPPQPTGCHKKDLASAVHRTVGGGEPLPIRGTFS